MLLISSYGDLAVESEPALGAPCPFLRKPLTIAQLTRAALEALQGKVEGKVEPPSVLVGG